MMTNDFQKLGSSGASLGDASGRFAVSTAGMTAQWFRGLTINAHERLALAHLWQAGSMTMSDLGSRIPLSRAAVTALTDRLEALGYVRRTPDEHDRRRTMLSLTDVPARLASPMIEAWGSDVRQLEESFAPADRAVIGRWLEQLSAINHRHAAQLRVRRDEEIAPPAPVVVR